MSRLIYLLLLAWPLSATGQTEDAGRKLFALHCAACHGRDATGEGALSPAIDAAPADLTSLARRNGGRFPTLEVIERIDGRTPVAAHDGAMPVYGWFFEGPEAVATPVGGPQVATTADMAALVNWLASIQR